jgi:glycosyltransferase involved in cell wall biosynthesis
MTENSEIPLMSIVVPAYGRVEPLKYTLRSAVASIGRSGYSGEIIVVDDGSEHAIEEQLAGFDARHPVRFVRQPNQGSIVARLTGLREAKGKYIQFLDSDDLLHPDKLRMQLPIMEKEGLDVSYTDTAKVVLGADYQAASFAPMAAALDTSHALELFSQVQPLPHTPVYRRRFLMEALLNPLVPMHRMFDPSGDIWLCRCLTLQPAKIRKIPGAYAGIGPHEEGRYSHCWERLGVASLGVDEAFMTATKMLPDAVKARRMVAEVAYASWRLLPYDVPKEYDSRQREVWQSVKGVPACPSRGMFAAVDVVLGPLLAGKIYRWLRRPSYAQCKTLRDEQEFAELMSKLPEIGGRSVSHG